MSRHIPIIHDHKFMNPRKFDLSRIDGPFFRTEEKDVLAPHRHDFYEIFWIVEGSGTVHIDFKKYALHQQTLCFIAPGQVHGWSFDKADLPLSGYLIKFNKELLLEQNLNLFPADGNDFMNNVPVYAIGDEQKGVFDRIFELLHRECRAVLTRGNEAVSYYLRLLSIEIQRVQYAEEDGRREERAYSLTKAFLNEVENNFKRRLGTHDYALSLFVTPNHLIQTVKRTLGKTAGEVIRDRQLLEGKRLLQFSELSVEEISAELGFADPSYFGRVFKRHIGCSPSKFRARL